MKKKIATLFLGIGLILLLTACGKDKEVDVTTLTPDDYDPEHYTFDKDDVDEDALPDDTYYIVKTTKNEVKYYPIYTQCETTISGAPTNKTGSDINRIIWVNYNLDEGLIPTLEKDDILIYKSHTLIPSLYAMEKFHDYKYTFGIAGLVSDVSGKYKYQSANNSSVSGTGIVQTTSDAAGLDTVKADSIYFASVGDVEVTDKNVNQAGAISGLDLMEQYQCDIREGTTQDDVTLTANIRLFSSAETYMFSDFDFITPYIAQINIPDYMSTGYYSVNAGGFFKYNKDDSAENNTTIYTYDEYGALNGAMIDGTLKCFDSNGFIIDYDDLKADETAQQPVVARVKNQNGYFGGNYYINYISKQKTNSIGKYYDIETTGMNGESSAQLRFYTNDKELKDIVVGNAYDIEFDIATNSSNDNGIGVIKTCILTQENAEAPITEVEEVEEQEDTDEDSTDTGNITSEETLFDENSTEW